MLVFEVSKIVDQNNRFFLVSGILFSLGLFFPSLLFRDSGFIIGLFLVILIFNIIFLFSSTLKIADFEKLSIIFYWCLYINFALISIIWLINSPTLIETRTGTSLILLTCLATFSNDTFAYLCGRMFGKHPLFLSVSQKKNLGSFFSGSSLSILFGFCRLLSASGPWL